MSAPRRSRLSVMNFLNEVASDYPAAISFASGRPAEDFFDFDGWLQAIPRFREHLAAATTQDLAAAGRTLVRYGRTNGLINDLVAAQLAHDEGLHCRPEQVVITAGCQEALALCIQTLCERPGDVVLARNPTYIGATGAAELAGVALVPLPNGQPALAVALRESAAALAAAGKRPRLLYLIPEFDNPTGDTLPLPERQAILAACAELGIIVLEDNPYGMFRFEGKREPPLAALDRAGTVIYLGTYSKTLCPAVRVGCAVVPPTLFGSPSASHELVSALGQRKSFWSVNTSPLNQALVGGVLLAEGGSLRRLVAPAIDHYRRNRDLLVAALAGCFAGNSEVRWNHPAGGFFLSVDLPFPFGEAELLQCASEYRVIPMPMSFFALDDSQQNRIRLAYSNATPAEIEAGAARLARFIRDRQATQAHSAEAPPKTRPAIVGAPSPLV